MDCHPQFAAAAQDDKAAGKRHEKHQDRNDANRNRGRVAFGRGRPLAVTIAIVAATVAVIAPAWGWSGAASTAADVFDDDLDVWNCGCARHGEFFSTLRTLFLLRTLHSELYSPDL